MAKNPAAYPFRVNKVVISGTCWNGQEQWSTGFYLGNLNSDAPDPGTTSASGIAPFWTTFFTAASTKVATVYKTHQIKVSQLEPDGDVDLSRIDIYDYPEPITGTHTLNLYPPQITLAATLTSDLQRGLASKGRMYLPGIAADVTTTSPKISATDASNVATNLKTFFDGVNASGAVSGVAILASKGHKVDLDPTTPDTYSYTGGKVAEVTGLRVGDVFDTQRRRRDGIQELFQAVVLA